MILVTARRAKLVGADFRFTDGVGIDLEGADIRWADLRNADFTKANLQKTRIWGARIRKTKLPPAQAQWLLLLRISQLFRRFRSKSEKLREARERKRVREVADLVRKREATRKRRHR